MDPDDHSEKLAEEVREIYDQQVDALRRAGVAERKEEGLNIESVEAVRLFRQATGYLTRLRELRDDIQSELRKSSWYHAERVIGHLDDYNRILGDIRRNRTFENSVSSFSTIEYEYNPNEYTIQIEDRIVTIQTNQEVQLDKPLRNARTKTVNRVKMDGTTTVEMVVYPRLVRLTKEVEQSIIGRCASGKTVD